MKHFLDLFRGYQVNFLLVGWGTKFYLKIKKKPPPLLYRYFMTTPFYVKVFRNCMLKSMCFNMLKSICLQVFQFCCFSCCKFSSFQSKACLQRCPANNITMSLI